MDDKIIMLGNEIIKYIAKTLPSKPGVYQMESGKGEILYIGKAKNLAKRVINYTSIKNLTRRLQRMVTLTKKMTEVRQQKLLDYIYPDGKSQVTIEYNDGKPTNVNNIVLAQQHSEDTKREKLEEDLIKYVIILHQKRKN